MIPLGDRILRVDHAGEHGAVCIYGGQIAVAKIFHPTLVEELRDFRAHEMRHRALFAGELARRGRPRCKSYYLCGIGGFALGLISGLLGRSAIAVTTVAVEEVVLRHLNEQINQLRGLDDAAVTTLTAIWSDEQLHHDQSLLHLSKRSFWSVLISPIVSRSTEAVIWLGMRL